MVFIILIDHLKGSDITNFSFSRCSNTDIYSWGSIFHGWFVMRVVHCGNYKTAAGPNLSNCSVHCIFNIFLTSFLSRESDDFIWTWHDRRRYILKTHPGQKRTERLFLWFGGKVKFSRFYINFFLLPLKLSKMIEITFCHFFLASIEKGKKIVLK